MRLRLKKLNVSVTGRLLMDAERFLEKETCVRAGKQVAFCSGEWEDGIIVTGHSRSWLDVWGGWTGNMGAG